MRITNTLDFMRNIPEFNNKAALQKIPSLLEQPNVQAVNVDNFRSNMVSSTDDIQLSENPSAQNFEQLLLKAFDSMNAKQTKLDSLSEQMIVNPESVDVHDITVAMAEAGLSLKIAQTFIDRVVKTWNDITTAR